MRHGPVHTLLRTDRSPSGQSYQPSKPPIVTSDRDPLQRSGGTGLPEVSSRLEIKLPPPITPWWVTSQMTTEAEGRHIDCIDIEVDKLVKDWVFRNQRAILLLPHHIQAEGAPPPI